MRQRWAQAKETNGKGVKSKPTALTDTESAAAARVHMDLGQTPQTTRNDNELQGQRRGSVIALVQLREDTDAA